MLPAVTSRLARIAFDDGWQSFEELPPFKTTVTIDSTRKIITRNNSPDISFDRSINPYRGCEHGCIYCFARPTHAYLGLSPGLDFESKLFAKPDAPKLLERELSAPGYMPRTIAIGTNTDPYQPIEREHQVMRRILEVLERCRPSRRHRDEIGAGAARPRHSRPHGATQSGEGRAVGDDARWQARARDGAARGDAGAPARCAAPACAAGVPASVMVAPVIPALNDAEIERILDTAAARRREGGRLRAVAAAAGSARSVPRMADGEFPRPLPHVFKLIREMRGGKDYDFELGQAHDRRRSGRLDDRPALRARLREARLEQDPHGSDHANISSRRVAQASS